MNEKLDIILKLREEMLVLMNAYREEKLEKAQFLDKYNELNEELKKKDEIIAELQKKYETLKFAKTLETTAKDKQHAKLKINQIVREIDKCLALLNK